MNVTIIFLDYLRHDYTERVKAHNFANTGYPFDVVTIDKKGVSAAINEGLYEIEDGAAFTMANDILMPDNWLKDLVHYAENIPDSGIIGIHTVEGMPPAKQVNGLTIYEGNPFGNVLITRECIDKIGYYNTDLDPYSVNDYDYVFRAQKSGLRTYYIPGSATHLGWDVGDGTPYRKMKDEGLQNSRGQQWLDYYQATGNYFLPYEQEDNIIHMKQFEGE